MGFKVSARGNDSWSIDIRALNDRLEFLKLSDQEKVRHFLQDDFERLTAQPVILDDLCMLLLEKHKEAMNEIHAFAYSPRRMTLDDMIALRMRPSQIEEELTVISALILRYPDVPRPYEARAHIQLDWEALRWLVMMPLPTNIDPRAQSKSVFEYTKYLLRNIKALTIVREDLK